MSSFRKTAGYNVNIQNLVTFLFIGDEDTEKEIRENSSSQQLQDKHPSPNKQSGNKPVQGGERQKTMKALDTEDRN